MMELPFAVLFEPTAIAQSVVFILPMAILADVFAVIVLSVPKSTLAYGSAILAGILKAPNILAANNTLYNFMNNLFLTP